MKIIYVIFIYSYSYLSLSSGISRTHNCPFLCGLVAQWIEHCTGIATSWVRIPFKPEFFFSGCFFNCLSWKHTARIKIHSSYYLLVVKVFNGSEFRAKAQAQAAWGHQTLARLRRWSLRDIAGFIQSKRSFIFLSGLCLTALQLKQRTRVSLMFSVFSTQESCDSIIEFLYRTKSIWDISRYR